MSSTGSTQLDINDLGLTDYTVRPLARADARAVFELMAEGELETIGEVAIEEADIVSDWQRPSFDLGTQTIGVFDGEKLVAYAEVYRGRYADAAVAAEHTEATVAGETRSLAGQPCLADACLAGDEQVHGIAGGGTVEGCLDRLELRVAADDDRAADAGRHEAEHTESLRLDHRHVSRAWV